MTEQSARHFQGPPVRAIISGERHKPDLLLYDVGGERVVLKTYRAKPGAWRSLVGVFATAREARALRALDGVQGVPAFRGRPDRYSVAMTYLPGRRARRSAPDIADRSAFVRELETIVRRMHERGVVHLDLKHRTNVLVSPEGRPVVLDFESALRFSPRWFGGRLAVRWLGWLDWLAVQNWKRRICPELLDASEDDRRQAHLARRLRGWWVPRRIIGAFVEILVRRHPRNRPFACHKEHKGNGRDG